MENRPIPELQAAFDAVLMAPFASHKWQARRSRSHWVDLEPWQDAIAGPLSSIAKSGGCEHVYSRNDEYFTGVVDPETLRQRLLEWHAGLTAGVDAFCPRSPAETEDLSYMRAITDEIRELIEQSYRVEMARWKVEHGRA
jgi:hypothetical protein